MAQRVQCPGCGKGLRIPDGVTEPLLSCPHCLTQLPYPQAASPPGAGIQTAPSPEARVTTCPTCGERVEGSWRYCPACQEDLRSPGGRRFAPGTDVAVRRDQRGTGVMLILLAVLGGLGFGYGLLIAWVELSEGSGWPPVFFLAVVLGIGAFSAVRVYNKPQPPTGARGVGQVVVRTLAGIGCLFGILIVVGIASFIIFLIVCLTQLSGHH